MIVAVADTHVAQWHLLDGSSLSRRADAYLMETAATGDKIAVSSISLIEVVYLVDKRRIPLSAYHELVSALADPSHLFVEVAVSAEIAEAMRRVPRDEVPDMPDRIVAATGLHLGVPVISRDGRIRAARLTTIW
jgi:PIN domain nuclease of toxin-antitoxin system